MKANESMLDERARPQLYTRRQACQDVVGCGPYQGFFAHKDGVPRAIFPRTRYNPFAREGILCPHDATTRPRSGPMLEKWLEERNVVHMFWEAEPAWWEHAGLWRPKEILRSGPDYDYIMRVARALSPEWPPVMVLPLQRED